MIFEIIDLEEEKKELISGCKMWGDGREEREGKG